MSECKLCPRCCKANRVAGERGFCGADNTVRVARAALHLWEEPCISGMHGAGAVFFSHCSLRCVFCQNYEISGVKESGISVTTTRLAEIFLELQAQGAQNIELVTPSHYVLQIIKALELAHKKGLTLPIVYNCSGYENIDVLKLLKGIVDVYMPDFKFYSSYYADRYTNAADYFEIAAEALTEMVSQVGEPRYNIDGIMTRGVLVRHLMLPGLLGDTKQILRYLAQQYKNKILVSLMRQYTPMKGIAKHWPELNRTVSEKEYQEAIECFVDFGLSGFMQEEGSISESFIPKWDYEIN